MLKFVIRYAQWIIAVFGFLVFGLTQTNRIQSLVLWQQAVGVFIDERYLWRSERLPDPDIKLIGVTTSSLGLTELSPEEIAASQTLQLMQHPWPWDNRSIYAAILEKLMDAGAKVVVFDFVFASQAQGDDVFAKALQKYKDHVVIGSMFTKQVGEYTQYTPPNQGLLLPGVESTIGVVNTYPDSDGVVRHGRYRTSLARESTEIPNLFASESFTNLYPDDLIHLTTLAVQKFSGKVSLPPSDNFIDFQGATGIYTPLPVEDMFVPELWEAPPFNGGMTFSNKIVVVGPIAEIFKDIYRTPFGETPGPEIQAQTIAALLNNSWLTEPPSIFEAVLSLLLMWVALEICLRINNAFLKVPVLVGAVAVFLVACQIAFTKYKLILPMMQPLFCLVVTGAFGIVFQYALEQVERLRYRNILGRYVSENVAKAVLDDKRSFEESLRGLKKPVTILFSDIRGFTSMTEGSDADKLVSQLNEYFLEMVGVVLKEGGTLQKFIGDAMMAAWGDTHSSGLQNDAQRAVRAALEMRPKLAELNARWNGNADRQKLAIGIGVNHGDVIVGNIGHPQRMEFTVIGDGVNLAARLESATKQFRSDILVGETVEALTREQFIFRSVDLLTVKGKSKPVEVFALLSDRSLPPPAWLTKYQDAVKLYRNRKFAEAANQFEAARKEIGVKDYLCEMYIERCEVYIEQPPPEDWDGSYALSEK
ncbi:MAG TPA: adenylate/guanylate cyclase domain-containing protein [Verrucomicrobiae bacterium]|jgi:adenylate cyclase